jgi:hypothetical protein
MQHRDLLGQLGLFDSSGAEALRAVRRPAGVDLVVEYELKSGEEVSGLPAFWLACLWRFLEDSQQKTDAFEGLAFQALAERLDAHDFERDYAAVRSRLTLPPPYPIELREAYRTLNGRLVSFTGITTDGEYWSGFYQADVFELLTLSEDGL